ncbi:OmpA family protein [Microbacterium caowuchunii]|uniref:OmpA family protein n=1 Tax=Microbacterium caowuchunii TaxID=2614638 RepID=A0A5N0TKG6_9MICO|nr:OmpA family protein [Microbacterium caowuchunii]KAA9135492.1 OmpA family protein [Microbacterium caowuchunii]
MGTAQRSAYGAALALALVLTGCAAAPTPDPDPADTPAATDEVVETISVTGSGGEIEVALHPLVRIDDHLVLTADITAVELPEGEKFISPRAWFDMETIPGVPVAGGALRLIDATSGNIHLPAVDTAGAPIGSVVTRSLTVRAEPVRLQRVFAAPEEADAAMGLVLPGAYLDAFPVVDGEPPETEDDLALDDIDQAPVVPLESTTRELDGAVQVTQSSETLQISLSGDVLFAFGSAELGADAATILGSVVETLGTREAGVVDIVGHTDDVGDDASNQALSEARAAAVADALGSLLESDEFELRPSGRGESAPVAANDSDANRQLNRRVSLTLTTTRLSQTEVAAEGQLPPFEDGPIAPGPEGVELDMGAAGTFQVAVPSARRVDGMLSVVVEATRTDDGAYRVGTVANLSPGPWSYRGEGAGTRLYPFAPRLVVGTSALYPLDYPIGARGSDVQWRLAGQTEGRDGASGGQTLRFLALFPDLPEAETLTLETDGGSAWSTTYRLTDIPIE